MTRPCAAWWRPCLACGACRRRPQPASQSQAAPEQASAPTPAMPSAAAAEATRRARRWSSPPREGEREGEQQEGEREGRADAGMELVGRGLGLRLGRPSCRRALGPRPPRGGRSAGGVDRNGATPVVSPTGRGRELPHRCGEGCSNTARGLATVPFSPLASTRDFADGDWVIAGDIAGP
jgi:hypothetical protein